MKASILDLIELADTPEKKNALLKVLADRDKAEAKARFSLEKILFKQQFEMLNSSAKRKVLVTSRRSGKSTVLAAFLLNEAMKNPRTVHCYVSLTKGSAKKIIWDMLMNFIEDFKLPFDCNSHELIIKCRNGSSI